MGDEELWEVLRRCGYAGKARQGRREKTPISGYLVWANGEEVWVQVVDHALRF